MDVSLADAFPRTVDFVWALQRPVDFAALEMRVVAQNRATRPGEPPFRFNFDLRDPAPPRPRKLRTRRERRERNARLQAEAAALGVTVQELRLARDAAARLAPPAPRFSMGPVTTGRLSSSKPNLANLPRPADLAPYVAELHQFGSGP